MRAAPRSVYNIAVIGGGVVGCAVLRAFTLAGAKTVLLERGPDILSGASKANSAILHTGFDAPADSLERACIRAGREEFFAVRERLNLPLIETSALMVAWDDDELARLPALCEHAHRNGVDNVVPVSGPALRRREPHLSDRARGALLIPDEHVIDPWSTPLAYALQALANGAVIERDCDVRGGRLDNGLWQLETSVGAVHAEVVVNCAGLYGDLVEAISRPSPFRILPRKGQFVVFDKPAAGLVGSIILSVPNERTKGVLLARTAFGNLLVGPTAEDQDARDDASVDEAALRRLVAAGERIVPALADETIVAVFAGIRPATPFKDYQIEVSADRQWITVAGIRSTGLTAALGIGAHVTDLYQRAFRANRPVRAPVWTPVPNLAEGRPRPYQRGGSGEIVCHCEWVTRAEIEAALDGPLPARELGGLKRRTRTMLGRCQGFYCGWRVAQLVRARLPHAFDTAAGP